MTRSQSGGLLLHDVQRSSAASPAGPESARALTILMFCQQFAPVVGGAERQAEKLSKALVRNGVRVSVLTPKLFSESPELEDDAGVIIHRFPLFDIARRFPSIPGLGLPNLLGLSIQTRRAAFEAIKSCDVVHAHGVSSLTAFVLSVARKLRKPLICKLASSGSGFDLKKLSEIGLGGNFLAHYLRDHVTAWIATSGAVAGALIDFGIDRGRILHIPNGVEEPDLEGCRENRAPLRRFLYAGRLSRACDRDFDTVLDAFFALAVHQHDVELALVGDGDLFDAIKAKADQSPCRSRIHLPGLVKDPAEWFAWADFFVLPSRREGMSNALLEAMAYGLVAIANDIPANREVLDDGRAGCLTPVGDAVALEECMRRLLSDREDAEQLRARALSKVRGQYSMEAVALQCLSAYRRLASNQGSNNN